MSRDAFDWFGAVLIITGVVVFLWGGAQHPATDDSLGAVGTEEYFEAFAGHVATSDRWQVIHTGILAGPLLWALGLLAIARRTHGHESDSWSQLGVHSMTMGAIGWSIVFVLDGFVAPLNAAAVLDGGTIAAVNAFRTNQEIVIRLGLVSWLLIGVGIAATSVAMLTHARRRRTRVALATVGLVVGLWPIAAWVTGEFVPGPFTSALWTATAVLTSLWFLASATAVIVSPEVRQPPHRPFEQGAG